MLKYISPNNHFVFLIDFNQSRCLSHGILIYRELFLYLYLLNPFLHSSHHWLVAHHWTKYRVLHFAAGHRTRLFPLEQRLMLKHNWWEESAWHILTRHNQPIAHRFPLRRYFWCFLLIIMATPPLCWLSSLQENNIACPEVSFPFPAPVRLASLTPKRSIL